MPLSRRNGDIRKPAFGNPSINWIPRAMSNCLGDHSNGATRFAGWRDARLRGDFAVSSHPSDRRIRCAHALLRCRNGDADVPEKQPGGAFRIHRLLPHALALEYPDYERPDDRPWWW